MDVLYERGEKGRKQIERRRRIKAIKECEGTTGKGTCESNGRGRKRREDPMQLYCH
jgi:hypothetical protein